MTTGRHGTFVASLKGGGGEGAGDGGDGGEGGGGEGGEGGAGHLSICLATPAKAKLRPFLVQHWTEKVACAHQRALSDVRRPEWTWCCARTTRRAVVGLREC